MRFALFDQMIFFASKDRRNTWHPAHSSTNANLIAFVTRFELMPNGKNKNNIFAW